MEFHNSYCSILNFDVKLLLSRIIGHDGIERSQHKRLTSYEKLEIGIEKEAFVYLEFLF